jgi:hypothetical protein
MMRRIDLVFAAMVGVAALAAYVAYPYLSRPASVETAGVSVPPSAPVAEALAMASPPAEVERPPEPQVAPAPPAVLPSPPPPVKPDIVAPRSAAAKSATAARGTPEATTAAPARSPLAVSTRFASEAANAPAASQPTRVAAAPPSAPARKDRLQQMNDTIAGCANEGLFARIACEQRALLAYCDGQWGRNDRCPSGRTADYGN